MQFDGMTNLYNTFDEAEKIHFDEQEFDVRFFSS
jgi:hypothetical protein